MKNEKNEKNERQQQHSWNDDVEEERGKPHAKMRKSHENALFCLRNALFIVILAQNLIDYIIKN